MKTYKQIKKSLRITDAEVSKMFGYSSVHSFRNAARVEQVKRGIEQIYNLVKTNQDDNCEL